MATPYGYATAPKGVHGFLSDLDRKGEPYQIRVHSAGLTATPESEASWPLDVLAHNQHAILAVHPTSPCQKFIINLDLCPVVEIIELSRRLP